MFPPVLAREVATLDALPLVWLALAMQTRSRAQTFTAPARARKVPTDGRVACPMCSKPVKVHALSRRTSSHKTPSGYLCVGSVFMTVDTTESV